MRVGIVGAGLAGLMAGRTFVDGGHEVVLFDKGRSPGGRLATRRIGEARFDHGAQFFTVRDPAFAEQVDAWERNGVVFVWTHGFAHDDGYPRYAVRGGMNALAKHLAIGLDVRCEQLVFSVVSHEAGWRITIDDATTIDVDAVVMTCPIPQSFSLLFGTGVELPELLRRTDYDRTLAVLVALDGPGTVPAPGGVQGSETGEPVFSFIGDNAAKGISPVPALTFHANAAWSEAHWDDPPEDTHAELLRLATPWFGGAAVVESQLKRWRFATPRAIWPARCWTPIEADAEQDADAPPTLAVAGDAFGGPRVEGAALSGIAAARALMG